MTHTSKHNQAGMSLIEIMIALAIMLLIASLIGPRVMGLLGKGKKTATTSTLKAVAAGIKQFKVDVGVYPEKLEDLISKPEGVQGWDGPYAGNEDSATPEVQKDGWGQDLRYERMPRGQVPPYKLWSLGDPDKEDDPIYAQ